MAGKITGYDGKIIINNQLIDDKNRENLLSEHISYLTQDSLIFDEETVIDNLLLPFDKRDKEKAILILKEMGLQDAILSKAKDLSAGEKQRLSFARVLYEPKEIILIDEITSNLDEENSKYISNKIAQLSKDHLVIFATHEQFLNQDDDQYNRLVIKEGQIAEVKRTVNDRGCIKDIFIKSGGIKTDVLNAYKREKSSHVICFIITLILSFASMLLCSIGFSFESKTTKTDLGVLYESKYREKLQDVYSKTTPVFLASDEDKYNGYGYNLIYDMCSKVDINQKNTKDIGSAYSGMFVYPKHEDIGFQQIEITIGREPKDEGEVIISDFCYQHFDGDKALPSKRYIFQGQYTVVGVYKGLDLSNMVYRYQDSENKNIDVKTRISYAFMSESIFGFTSNKMTNYYAYQNTIENQKVYLNSDGQISSFYNPIAIDKSGKDALAIFKNADVFKTSAYSLMIISGMFYIAFIITFYVRNKRKYLLLRFLGTSRNRFTRGNVISFSITTVISFVLAFLLSQLAIFLMNNSYSHVILGCAIRPFEYMYMSVLHCFGIAILFIAVFSVVIYKFLVKKDLDKQISEVKKR